MLQVLISATSIGLHNMATFPAHPVIMRRIRMIRAMIRMIERAMNRAHNEEAFERWKNQHQRLVGMIADLMKKEA